MVCPDPRRLVLSLLSTSHAPVLPRMFLREVSGVQQWGDHLYWSWCRAQRWKTDWITIGDLETTIWKLRFGNYGWETNNLCFSNCVSPIWKLWFRNYKSPIWKPNLRDLTTKNLRFGNYVLGTEIPRFGNSDLVTTILRCLVTKTLRLGD